MTKDRNCPIVPRPKTWDSGTGHRSSSESGEKPPVLGKPKCPTAAGQNGKAGTGGKRPYRKGYRAEREMVERHAAMGIDAKRSFMSKGADLVIDGIGDAEVKARRTLPATVNRWLGERAVLFMRPDRAEPAVLMTWETYHRLVTK